MEKVWREDSSKRGQRPTLNFLVIHATDIVQTVTIYNAVVVHVDAFKGRGFEARVMSDGSVYPGGFFVGEDQETYEKAETAAKSLLTQKSSEMKQRLADARE